jgi:hypothetical protein
LHENLLDLLFALDAKEVREYKVGLQLQSIVDFEVAQRLETLRRKIRGEAVEFFATLGIFATSLATGTPHIQENHGAWRGMELALMTGTFACPNRVEIG